MSLLERLSAQTGCLWPSLECAQEGKCVNDNQRWMLRESLSAHLTLSLRWQLTMLMPTTNVADNSCPLVVAKGQEYRVGGRSGQPSRVLSTQSMLGTA